ncbi:rhomboid family intramembrane serine protease [Rhodobacterales bacterium HKCCE2091]|nr:rhomboid family intramembrane serine protease [Rhodobacterales bacterium HKCCE2091]
MILGLVLSSTAIEAVLLGSDLGLWGPARLRQLAYDYGGFWPGLLQDWPANYPGQPALMFLTYAFLHGGPGHLAVNMVTLWSLAGGVAQRVKARGLLLLYLGSALGGAAGYGLLATGVQPMVGASGALFGLAGGLLAWAYVDRFSAEATLWPVARVALLLVAMNVAMYWALGGQLAWQTHLGGFAIGWVLALLLDPRPREAAG